MILTKSRQVCRFSLTKSWNCQRGFYDFASQILLYTTKTVVLCAVHTAFHELHNWKEKWNRSGEK